MSREEADQFSEGYWCPGKEQTHFQKSIMSREGAAPFSKELMSREANRRSQKLSPLKNGEKLHSVSSHFKKNGYNSKETTFWP